MILNKKTSMLKGSILVYGLVIMFMVSVIMTSIIGFIAGQTKYSLQIHAREQAFQIAESGIHFYRWYLAHQVEGRTAQQVADFWSTGSPYGVGSPYVATYRDPSGDLVGEYALEVTPPDPGSTIITVRATGFTYKYPDLTRTIEVRFRRPSWSESAVLANDVMRFGAGTEVYGKIHSNNGIRFDGVAHNLVTSSLSTYDDPDHNGGNEFAVHTHDAPTDPLPPAAVPSRPDIFEAGRSFPEAAVDFNGVLGDLSVMKAAAQASSSYFLPGGTSAAGRQIILKTNGTYDVCKVRTVNTGYSITQYARNAGGGSCGTCTGNCAPTNHPIPDDGVIFIEGNAWVSGTINDRKVTVVAGNLLGGAAPSVYILNDIRYTNTDGRDIIGIIGQNNIEIGYASENDLRIDAALLAQQGRVGREHYSSPKGLNPDVKTTITINGAIATNQRYGFAWTDGTGYQNRNLYYDNNLLYYPPPYFPTGTQYEMDLWQEE